MCVSTMTLSSLLFVSSPLHPLLSPPPPLSYLCSPLQLIQDCVHYCRTLHTSVSTFRFVNLKQMLSWASLNIQTGNGPTVSLIMSKGVQLRLLLLWAVLCRHYCPEPTRHFDTPFSGSHTNRMEPFCNNKTKNNDFQAK